MERVKGLRVNPKNPRKITDAKLSQLRKSMDMYGDISGIVHNRRSGNLLGGNQRSKNLDETSKVVITKRYSQRTPKGTVATGYILHKGERFAFREVDWDPATEEGAMIAANKNAGEWSKEKLGASFKRLATFDVDFDLELTMFDKDELKPFLPSVTVAEHKRKTASGEANDSKEEYDRRCPGCGMSLAFMAAKPKVIVRKNTGSRV